MKPLRREVTPYKIAKAIGVHPTTAKERIKTLWKEDKLLDCRYKGKVLMCKLDRKKVEQTKFFDNN